MKTFTTLAGFTLTAAALAQTPPAQTGIEKATFGMAKATLEFLATDTKTFPKAQEKTCKDCEVYGDLSAFIQKNSLTKADGLVGDIQKQSRKLNDSFAADGFATEEAMLDSLQHYIINRVTGGPERAHRRQLASFTTYETRLDDLAVGSANAEPAADTRQTADLQGSSEPVEEPATSALGGFAWGTWLYWLPVIILVLILYYWLARLQMRMPKTVQGERDDIRIAGLQDEVNRLSTAVAELGSRLTMAEKKLTSQNAQLQNRPAAEMPSNPPRPQQTAPQAAPQQQAPRPQQPTAPQQPVNQPRTSQPGYGQTTQPNPSAMPMSGMSQMGTSGQQPMPMAPSNVRPTPTVAPPPSETVRPMSGGDSLGNIPGGLPTSNVLPTIVPVSSPTPIVNTDTPPPADRSPLTTPPPPAPAPTTRFYARTADLGNGFSVSGLVKEPERGTVYDIILTSPTTAAFQVSQSPEAQQVALSDLYSYLSDACLYENQPSGATRIQNVAPGQLMLQGDKWQITEKARIGFV